MEIKIKYENNKFKIEYEDSIVKLTIHIIHLMSWF
jgi:hypothetical protein